MMTFWLVAKIEYEVGFMMWCDYCEKYLNTVYGVE
jgi:hypothetical protein